MALLNACKYSFDIGSLGNAALWYEAFSCRRENSTNFERKENKKHGRQANETRREGTHGERCPM